MPTSDDLNGHLDREALAVAISKSDAAYEAVQRLYIVAHGAREAAMTAADGVGECLQAIGRLTGELSGLAANILEIKRRTDSMRPKVESVPDIVQHAISEERLRQYQQTEKDNKKLKAALVVAVVGGVATAIAAHFIH